MKYKNLGNTGLKVSPLCLGCMTFGVPERGDHTWTLPESQSRPIIRQAVEAGINFFDIANVYSDGTSEEIVGRALKDYTRRDEVVITSKVFFPMGKNPNSRGLSRKAIFTAIDASLRRLETDYIDLYQIHRWDYDTPIEETLEALNDVVKSGKVRYLGASSMYAWQFSKALHLARRHGWTPFVTMQNHYNLLYREEEREMIPYCADQGVGVSVFSPLARGLLTSDPNSTRNQTDFFTQQMYSDEASFQIAHSVQRVARARGVSNAQIAQAWVANHPGVDCMLVGADTPAQFDSALAALDTTLSADELFELERNYTPCDLINDYTAGKRIAREARLAQGAFVETLEKAA